MQTLLEVNVAELGKAVESSKRKRGTSIFGIQTTRTLSWADERHTFLSIEWLCQIILDVLYCERNKSIIKTETGRIIAFATLSFGQHHNHLDSVLRTN